MKIAVIGTGYVGLVTGPCLAEKGNDVVCADVDSSKIDLLKQGNIPIYEPGLEEIVHASVKKGHLSFTTDVEGAIKGSDIVFITVGTPPTEDGGANLDYVHAVADIFADVIKTDDRYRTLVTKSTVPPGETLRIKSRVTQKTSKFNFGIANNPEFLKEGNAIRDFRIPDRVVIGVDHPKVKEMLIELYAPFVKTGKPILVTDPTSSEMSKYASNLMLASRITLMNQLAVLAEKVGADIDQVRHIVGSDSRIGSQFLFPGPGYGGSCFPKDVEALIYLARKNGINLTLLEAVDLYNKEHRLWPARKVVEELGNNLEGRAITIWGAAFKPNTDDVRESPAVYVAKDLLSKGARLAVYDPEERTYPAFLREVGQGSEEITLHKKINESVAGADAVLIITDWGEFSSPDFEAMRSSMRTPLMIDARNLYGLNAMNTKGFRYVSLGRKEIGKKLAA